jgi:hypothetical protein
VTAEQRGLVRREERQLAGQPGGEQEHVSAARKARWRSSRASSNAWSTRKYAIWSPSGFTRTNSFGTWSRRTKSICATYVFAARSWRVPGRVEDLLEADRRLVRRRRQLAQADVLDDDVDLVGRGGRQERLERRGSGRSGRWWRRPARRLQEQQRVRVLALHRGPDAAEVLHDELRQEVAQLRRLRLVARRVVLHGLGAADLVDPDDERLHLGVARRRVEVEPTSPSATSETSTARSSGTCSSPAPSRTAPRTGASRSPASSG